GSHGIALMADDHDGRTVGNVRGEVENVVDERPPRGAMKDLDGVGLHPRAEAGGEDDHVEIVGHSFARIRSSDLPYRSYRRKTVSASAAESWRTKCPSSMMSPKNGVAPSSRMVLMSNCTGSWFSAAYAARIDSEGRRPLSTITSVTRPACSMIALKCSCAV